MKVAIHQPHYFPWMGYFDKMAKADVFILLDIVQMEKGSFMYRNRIVDRNGQIAFLTISAEKHGYLDLQFKDIQTKDDDLWLKKQKDKIIESYSKSKFFEEVWNQLGPLFENKETTICSYCVRSILRIKELLGIETKIIMQSELPVDSDKRKNDLVLDLCKKVGADVYISGNGARKYTDESSFESAGIELRYQVFNPPVYPQLNSGEFISGLSMIDALFCCGITGTKEIFWEGIKATCL